MNKSRVILFFVLGLMVALTACESSTNYSQLLKAEQSKIDAWIARNGIEVLNEMPADTVFGEKQYVKFDDGIYFRLVSKGVGDTLVKNDQVIVRFIQSTLDENPIVESYWDTTDKPYPVEITYGSLTNSCQGWQDAMAIMKRTDAHALFIVPSKLGFDGAMSSVTPLLYEMKIKIVPK